MPDTFELLLHEWRIQLDQRLSHLVDSHSPPILYDPVRYVLQSGGKRVRPLLLLLGCQAVGGDITQAWDAAVAIELLHDFTLVHDDIMDNDDTRRGRATVHKQWSPDIAILAGDNILALSYRNLLRTRCMRIQEILTAFTDAIITVCEGQALDLEFQTMPSVTMSRYLEMIGKKTAKLLNVSTRIGAIIGGGSESEVNALSAFANNLGLAFQVQDDLLDIISDEATLGKTHASDLQQHKQTFLTIHALANANGSTAKRLHELMRSEPGQSEIVEVKMLLESIGSIQAARDSITEYVAAAKECLTTLPGKQEKEFLLLLLNKISNRNS